MDKQDRVNKGGFSLGRTVSFFEAHKNLSGIDVSGKILSTDSQQSSFYYSTEYPPGEYVRCINYDCTEGGWHIGNAIRTMVANELTEDTPSGYCTGHHKSRSKQQIPKSCLTQFKATIKLTYKEDKEPEQVGDGDAEEAVS